MTVSSMRRLFHLLMSPPCRLVRLALGEKRVAFDLAAPDDPLAHVPAFADLDGTIVTGLWAVIDHIESEYPEPALVPADPSARGEALRLFDWTLTNFHEEVTRRIVFEKASSSYTGNVARRSPNMDTVRAGREALRGSLSRLGAAADANGFIAGRDLTLADLALAAHLSALDYYGEIPWTEYPPITEWYARIKSRPSFRPLLADKVPGQPPVPHYAELDF
jgi:glutathione S-transferase